jgi:hypothetical protein
LLSSNLIYCSTTQTTRSDQKLRNKEEAIAKSMNLSLWRNILNPPTTY